MAASRETFGTLPGGRAVEAVTLSNGRGLEARIIAWGAALQALLVPGRDGAPADVTLGYATLEDYLSGTEYFGCTVGRVANRIAGGRFVLDGQEFAVPVNNGVNSLHGGAAGFDKVLWEIAQVGEHEVSLCYVSPDGDQGYPGTLTATATYRIEPDADVLRIVYTATTDAPTVVNLSNHAYWNLAGEGGSRGVMDHLLTIPADHFTPTDAGAIPTGEIRPVEGTPFDFRRPMAIGARVRDASDEQIRFGKGYDHNWVLARDVAAAPRLLARLEDPVSGRVLEVHSNQPGLQFYSGNFLDASRIGKAGSLYRMGDGIALEPQKFPDTPNRPEFGSVRLDPGETYENVIEYRFYGDSCE
ncbi:MAG TPA: aldose epimerase family protein [Allosphingosinicella sp.]